jgi:hypothetical protein
MNVLHSPRCRQVCSPAAGNNTTMQKENKEMTSINHHRFTVILTAVFLLAALTTALAGDPVVRQGAGQTPADIQAVVDAFRADLGSNNGVGGTFGNGRREINWDAVPDARSAPNNLPANFFNANSPRGAVFATPGSGFQVSAKLGNPTSTLVRFGNLNSAYVNFFSTFSPERLFTALDSVVTDVNFFVPGTATPALTKGFGVVFTDINNVGGAQLDYYDGQGNLLFRRAAPIEQLPRQGLLFIGVSFDSPVIAWVRIRTGNLPLGPNNVDGIPPSADVAAMDDFIYGEPQAATNLSCSTVCFASRDYWRLHLKPCFSFAPPTPVLDDNVLRSIRPLLPICEPSALIHLPGYNSETPVSIQASIPQIKHLLDDDCCAEESTKQTLIAEYVAARPAFRGASGGAGLLRVRAAGDAGRRTSSLALLDDC